MAAQEEQAVKPLASKWAHEMENPNVFSQGTPAKRRTKRDRKGSLPKAARHRS